MGNEKGMEKKKKMTIDGLAQLTEERIQGVEKEVRAVKELVIVVVDLVKNIDGKMDNIKKSTASALEVAGIDLRVDALEKDMKRMKEKVKL